MRTTLSIAAATLAVVTAARADIFQWEYVNPADPSQGKRQSTTLCPDGAGLDAVPGAYLYNRNLTMAYLIGADLTGASAPSANLTDADLSQANLTGANFPNATLTGADFTNANLTGAYLSANLTGADFTGSDVRGASFNKSNFGTGISLAQLYSTASYQAHDLSGVGFAFNDLVGANFAGQNLTNANLRDVTLTDADFTGADIRGAFFARFGPGTGITLAQLYSTSSYQAHDLSGIGLSYNNLAGANFAGQNITNADFGGATLTGADFTNANLTGAYLSANLTGADFTNAEVRGASLYGLYGITLAQLYSTASYAAHDLSGIDLWGQNLSGANLSGQNLTNANLNYANLTGADFTGANLAHANLTGADVTNAEVRGAFFGADEYGGSGITVAQLSSTASYAAHDLSGIGLAGNDLSRVNFAGQNLTNANFNSATLTAADFTGADVRGTSFYVDSNYGGTGLTLAVTSNLIRPDGHVIGLDLDVGALLVVRDYDGDPARTDIFGRPKPIIPPIPITVDQHLAMEPGGTLRMVFEADEWDSTISFAPGIPVTLGGTLELTFADNVNLASQVGRTFDLFNWTGVSPTGAFAISSPYAWDLSNLYTTGQVTLTAIPESSSLSLVLMASVGWFCRRQPGRSRMRLFCLLGLVIQSVSANAAVVRTVALSGQPAPGTPAGVNYSSFGAHFLTAIARQTYRGPVINNAGQVAFRANVAGSGIDATNNQGVWSEGAGSLAMVARTGDAAPGVPDGVNFGLNYALELFEPVLNNAGQTAFYGGLTDGTVGLWSEGSGNLALVARDGTPAPGTPDGVNLSFAVLRDFFPGLPKLNDAGQVAFLANVTGEGVDNTNDWGLWSERTGGLGLVVRSGSPAPGTPVGVNYDSFFFQSGFNNAGQSAFFAFVTGDGVDPSNDQGIWSEGSGGLALVARSGTPAPGTPSGVNFREFIYPTVAFNSTGRTTFKGFLTGEGVDVSNDEGIWSESSGTLALVARRGSPAPGTPSGVNFDVFAVRPALSDAGQSAFSAALTGTGVTSANNQGIWLGEVGDLALVARTGNQAPGTPTGVQFSNLGRQTLNSAGQIAFRSGLTGTGVGTANNLGIWATDQDGALQLIARTGSQLEIAPGVFRTTSDLGIALDSGNSDGRASAFNDLGQLVFWASFTNGSQGVFVSNLVAHLPGDFNNDGTVDAADYVVWRKNDGTQTGYDTWRANFGRSLFTGSGSGAIAHLAPGDSPGANYAVPEPAGILIAATALGVLILRRPRRASAGCQWLRQCHPQLPKCTGTTCGTRIPTHTLRVVSAVAVCAALQLAPVITVEGAMLEFDSSRKSPAVIPIDPDGLFEARGNYVSGRVPTDVKGPVRGGTNINTLVGADAFYSQGYTGTNAVIANVEGGHIWSGHETLAHVQQIPNHPSALNEFDRHATWVGMVLGGRQGGANPGAYQEGLAPDAQLYSGAIATQFNGNRFATNFNLLDAATFDQYRRAFSTGVNAAGRHADVINSSWGSTNLTDGSDTTSIAVDGFANTNPRTLFVVSAGNSGAGPDKFASPAAAYNNMAVAALGPNPPYDRPALFSSGGPNDYADPVNGTADNARQVVDIAAPGENLSAAFYGGETGGNGTTDNPSVSGPGPTGLPSGLLGGPDFYTRGGVNGTSFAAPTVAGGAALLYDTAYSVFPDNADARDARVMKAVLMNSADKTSGWNNGQVAHPNASGGVLTTQGLDNRVGTGRLNLAAAYDQFLTGTTDIAGTSSGNLGLVNDIGWDFGQVVSGTTNDYLFNSPLAGGSTFTATLTWFRDRRINASNTVFDDSYDDLNLELWSVVGGVPTSLISESGSLYNESEHFSFALPATGDYALRVRWFSEVFDMVADTNQEFYGLAWSAVDTALAVTVPEPQSAILFTVAAMALGASKRKRHVGYHRPSPSPPASRSRSAAHSNSPSPTM